jgi:hypothetical protein
MLEAMASGCLVIGADTAPVREVIRHGENGWLVDFFDYTAIAERVVGVLGDHATQVPLRQRARAEIVERYSLQRGLAGYERLLGLKPISTANGYDKQSASGHPNKMMSNRAEGMPMDEQYLGRTHL